MAIVHNPRWQTCVFFWQPKYPNYVDIVYLIRKMLKKRQHFWLPTHLFFSTEFVNALLSEIGGFLPNPSSDLKTEKLFWLMTFYKTVRKPYSLWHIQPEPLINQVFMDINPWKFGQKQFTSHRVKFTNSQFTNSQIFNRQIQKIFLIHPHENQGQNEVTWMEHNLYDDHIFQPK